MTTQPTDDPLPRDPRFDTAWRAASSEEPPPGLDAAILAAAHRDVGAKPQSLSAQAAMRARRRWWPLAAAATVAVIAIGVVQRAGHDDLVGGPGRSSVVSDMPAQSATGEAKSAQSATSSAESAQSATSGERSKKLALEAQAPASVPATRADVAPSGSGGSVDGRIQSDAVARQSSAGAQPGSRTDAEQRTAPKPSAPLQKKADPIASATPPLEKKPELAANSAAPLPEPFPAAKVKSEATAAHDAAATAQAAERAAESPAALQRSEAGEASAKLAAPSPSPAAPPPPSALGPAPSTSPPAAARTSPSPASQTPPVPSFAERSQFAASPAAHPSTAAKTAMSGAATEARAKDRAPLPIPEWIALIRRLRDEGNVDEAARELAAFRKATADHEKLLPPDLRDWHPPEK